MPAYIKGVINLRGKVIPVMDVRLRFRMTEREYDDRTCIIVVSVSGIPVGLVVDTVKEVADIPQGQIEAPPDISEGNRQMFIRGLGKMGEDVKILLDVDKLVHKSDVVAVQPGAGHDQGLQMQAATA